MSFPPKDHMLNPEARASAFLKKNEAAGIVITDAERAELMKLVTDFYKAIEQVEAAGSIERNEAADA